MVRSPVTFQGFAIFRPWNWGIGKVFSSQVRDERALFPLLLALSANWTFASRKFLGQIFPLRVFKKTFIYLFYFFFFRDKRKKDQEAKRKRKKRNEPPGTGKTYLATAPVGPGEAEKPLCPLHFILPLEGFMTSHCHDITMRCHGSHFIIVNKTLFLGPLPV